VISKEREAEILRLYHAERWPIGTIASQLRVHHSTVRRVLVRAGFGDPVRVKRPSIIEPFLAFVREVLTRYPRLRASRLYEMVCERGYRGRPDHFRHLVAHLRPKPPAEAYLKLRTLPGEQAQVDWAHFGTARIGKAERPILYDAASRLTLKEADSALGWGWGWQPLVVSVYDAYSSGAGASPLGKLTLQLSYRLAEGQAYEVSSRRLFYGADASCPTPIGAAGVPSYHGLNGRLASETTSIAPWSLELRTDHCYNAFGAENLLGYPQDPGARRALLR